MSWWAKIIEIPNEIHLKSNLYYFLYKHVVGSRFGCGAIVFAFWGLADEV